MATMNISLPAPMRQWVEEQVATGRYANASDVMRDLIRREQDRTDALRTLQAEIDAGLASGVSERPVAEVFAEARRRGRAAVKARDAA